MLTISPIRRALVPVDSVAAQQVSAPNYDEFQSDREIWDRLQRNPACVLGITMPHCSADSPERFLIEGSEEALRRGSRNMKALVISPLTRIVEDALYVYEIADPKRPGTRQIGLGGMASIDQIRTEQNPDGSIIRNEGIREQKAQGRADLIASTRSFIGTVNNTLDDDEGVLTRALSEYADLRRCDFEAEDEHGNQHLIWLVTEAEVRSQFVELLAEAPRAYVADGNHRSAAAGLLDGDEFLAVFFPAKSMGLAPYNRLVNVESLPPQELISALERSFQVERLENVDSFQPDRTHQIGLYSQGVWYRLSALASSYQAADAAQSIDADIVQRRIFRDVFGIADPTDDRLTFVGGDRDANYLRERADQDGFGCAVTLAPVTMDQFIEVCRQNRIMPPKSTWFQPKIRSGLVIALLDG